MAAMASNADRVFSDELVNRLTDANEYSLKGMIRGLTLPPTAPLPALSSCSAASLGQLDSLPVELMHMVLVLLDVQSLVRLSQVARAAKVAVDGLPAYEDLRQHIPDVLVALGRTRMLHCHSVACLQDALRASPPRCASCLVSFGGFLFLPTCERVCFDCLCENRALRMTTPALARECFRLSASQLAAGVPVLHTIPGSYSVRWHKHHPKVHKLVSVRQAKAHAAVVHGSAQAVAALLPATKPASWSLRKYYLLQSFHEAPLGPAGRDLTLLPEQDNTAPDGFGGVASIRMPYVGKAGKADRGRCCNGCRILEKLDADGGLPENVKTRLVPPGVPASKPLKALGTRLYTEGKFVQHIRECYGVTRLLSLWDDGVKDPYGLE
ncbi:hypothetical protein SCUCBS95973_007446 [Sporothrix curviconia]|uniref:F-box domain-containing protein n=1 Tax=Sporothrix curviconia TaxID=1260050 RepID=A0ABP0CG27_9PEZI